jgi:hypothetical protein
MSDHTANALAKLELLAPILTALPRTPDTERVCEEMDALRRAVSAFHLEAIRFRMFNVERAILKGGDTYPPEAKERFAELRKALEEAGFHTRSHAAP